MLTPVSGWPVCCCPSLGSRPCLVPLINTNTQPCPTLCSGLLPPTAPPPLHVWPITRDPHSRVLHPSHSPCTGVGSLERAFPAAPACLAPSRPKPLGPRSAGAGGNAGVRRRSGAGGSGRRGGAEGARDGVGGMQGGGFPERGGCLGTEDLWAGAVQECRRGGGLGCAPAGSNGGDAGEYTQRSDCGCSVTEHSDCGCSVVYTAL